MQRTPLLHHGASRIWASDGTTASPNLLAETGPSVGPYAMGCALGSLLFWVDRGTDKMELWRSDGTPGGTSLVTLVEADVIFDVWSGSMWQSVSTQGPLFTLFDAGASNVWASDGTSAGTVPLVAPVPAPNYSLPRALADVNGTLLFSASDADHGRELWRSDGTPEGTVLVKDLEAGPGSSDPSTLLVTPSHVLISACPKATGCELCRTDGTDAGTVLVKDINPGPDSGFSSAMGRLGDVLIFVAHDALGWGPYRSDGTPDGTFRLGPPPADTQFVHIDSLGVLKGSLYFRKGAVLWRTDGTSEGTVAITPLPVTYSSGFLSASLDNVLLFSNDDGPGRSSLWKTDGTAAGTSMLASVEPVGSLERVGSRVFFWAWDDAHGLEPWTTDGTAAGTALLKDIYPGRPDSYKPESTAVLGSSLYFWADDGVDGLELWKTDGTSAGTTLVRDIAPGPASSYAGNRFVATGREAYFFAADPVAGPELWRTDGSEAGTTRVIDLNPGLWGSDVVRNMYWKEPLMSRSGGRMFYTATDGTTGYELWSLPIPLGFHPVTPCRVADTRDPAGPAGGVPLGASQTLILPVTGRCGIPSTAISVAANVTVVNPTATGALSVFAGGPIVSGTTEVPVTAGKTRAMNAIPILGTAGSLSVRADLPAGGTTHVLLDVSGYFE